MRTRGVATLSAEDGTASADQLTSAPLLPSLSRRLVTGCGRPPSPPRQCHLGSRGPCLPPFDAFSRCWPLPLLGASQKWSKGKVKEKLSNLVLFDKASYEKMITDIPKQRLITPSIISEKLKVNGSLARKAVKELVSKELIRPIMTHKHQAIYTRSTNT